MISLINYVIICIAMLLQHVWHEGPTSQLARARCCLVIAAGLIERKPSLAFMEPPMQSLRAAGTPR